MSPELLSRIFDPYFSTHDTGTGLGLPIARRIAEEHGGSIGARNRPGGGLEVTIRIPLMTTHFVRRMRWALAPLLLGLAVAACAPGDDGRLGRPTGPAVWVEPAAAALRGGEARTLSAAGMEEVFLDAATLDRWGSAAALAPVEGAFDAVPPGTPVTLVVRTPPDGPGAPSEPKAAGRALAAELQSLAAAAEEAGLYPLGVHLEPGDAAGGAPPPRPGAAAGDP